MSFEHGQKIYFRDIRANKIIEATFSEYWEFNSAYITTRDGHFQLPVDELFSSKEELIKKDIAFIEKQIKSGDSFVSNWNENKNKLLTKIEELTGEIKK